MKTNVLVPIGILVLIPIACALADGDGGGASAPPEDPEAVAFTAASESSEPEETEPFLPLPQAPGLGGVARSGPIVLVDKRTLFVPNLRFDGKRHRDAHFVVGRARTDALESLGMLESRVVVPDERGSLGALGTYLEKNVYLTLPAGTSLDEVDFFGVWSDAGQLDLGHVFLGDSKGGVPESSGFVNQTEDGRRILRVPKCCPGLSVLSSAGCAQSDSAKFEPDFGVFEHNDTHVNNESLSLSGLKFEPYVFSMRCSAGKYPLNPKLENFALLLNGSLILNGVGAAGVFSQGEFCIDAVEGVDELLIFICAPVVNINYAMFHAYLTLTIISTICFVGAFVLYYFILKYKDIHRKCFMAYSVSMFLTFLFLVIPQISHLEDQGCVAVGFLFQFCMISSFTWLAVLCFDIFYIVLYFDDDHVEGTRLKWYFLVALAAPLLSIVISLARSQEPDVPASLFKPQYSKNTCFFKENRQRIFFYVPIGFAAAFSAACLGYTKYKTVQNDKNLPNNYFWISNRRANTFMWRRYLIIVIIMSLWLLEAFTSMVSSTANGITMALDIIKATQGITVLLLFVINKDAKKQFLRMIEMQQNKKRRLGEEDLIMTPLSRDVTAPCATNGNGESKFDVADCAVIPNSSSK